MGSSVFDLYRIGIGPSSSHTVAPMRAARHFAELLLAKNHLDKLHRLQVRCFGSLAHTGCGHETDRALVMGLMGECPTKVDPDQISRRFTNVVAQGSLSVLNQTKINFSYNDDFCWDKDHMPEGKLNAMHFQAWSVDNQLLMEHWYDSVGGGAVAGIDDIGPSLSGQPYPFGSAKQLLELCAEHGLSIAQLTWANEKSIHDLVWIQQQIEAIVQAMRDCMARGLYIYGTLPGGLLIQRRAPDLYQKLLAKMVPNHGFSQWLNVYAMAVNEENAAGGRVVTAPTNGAAGVMPAVLQVAQQWMGYRGLEHAQTFLLTAGAIGQLFKQNASISGAEVGCQGEIGVASSMAAAGLTALMGGSVAQVENAAEIAMEHHLGLTCDPVHGLVQVPCIERNAMGANKAFNAAQLAISEDGRNHVSLDAVIKTMYHIGKNMSPLYRETAMGGLARHAKTTLC